MAKNCGCKVPINSREDFMKDPFFKSAREILENAKREMDKAIALQNQPKCNDEDKEDMQNLCERIFKASVDNCKQLAQNLQDKSPGQQGIKACACCSAQDDCSCAAVKEKVVQCKPPRTPETPRIFKGYEVKHNEQDQAPCGKKKVKKCPSAASQEKAICPAKNKEPDRPERYEVIMDMAGFKPEDIIVCTEDDKVEVNAVRKCQTPTGVSTKKVKRRYIVPKNVDTESLECNLSSDGVLVISADWLE